MGRNTVALTLRLNICIQIFQHPSQRLSLHSITAWSLVEFCLAATVPPQFKFAIAIACNDLRLETCKRVKSSEPTVTAQVSVPRATVTVPSWLTKQGGGELINSD